MTNSLPEYPCVFSVYMKDSTNDLPAMVEYCRPQDFATNPAWHYNYVEIKQVEPFPGLFKCHLYADVEFIHGDDLLTSQIYQLTLRLVKAGVPDYNRKHKITGERLPSMSPTDCLEEDDFWDAALGEPPDDCTDEDDDDD